MIRDNYVNCECPDCGEPVEKAYSPSGKEIVPVELTFIRGGL